MWSKFIWNIFIQHIPADIIPVKCLHEHLLPDLQTKVDGTQYMRTFQSMIQDNVPIPTEQSYHLGSKGILLGTQRQNRIYGKLYCQDWYTITNG